jgi:hypothetical protein
MLKVSTLTIKLLMNLSDLKPTIYHAKVSTLTIKPLMNLSDLEPTIYHAGG